MRKHRAVVIGAGRIGAGYQWDQDLAYTHAGAYQALKDRVELVGFIEPDNDRAMAAKAKWLLPVYEDVPTGLAALRPDIVSVCVQPEQQAAVLDAIWPRHDDPRYDPGRQMVSVWCEKPFVSEGWRGYPIQVNYMRRGDWRHQQIAESDNKGKTLHVYAKDDIHTRCHFEDLAKWWKVPLSYYPLASGPCSYILGDGPFNFSAFPMGGVDGGECFRGMLENLLDHVDTGKPLWSPAA